MDVNQLKTFCSVAKLRSFSKASNEVHLTQSAISRQVAQLEEDLGVRLFIRKRDGIVLTQQGELLLDRARKIVADVETLRNVVAATDMNVKGSLKVSMTVGLASMWVPFFLKKFGEQYPDVSLEILANDEDVILESREADVAIRPLMKGRPDLEQKYLQTFNMKLYASPEYLEKFGIPKTVEDLKNHRLLDYGRGPTPYDEMSWHMKLGLDYGEAHKPYISVNSGSSLFELAEQGLGITALAEEFIAVKPNSLVNVLPEVKGTDVDIFYIYPKELAQFKHITILGDYLDLALVSYRRHR